MEDVGTGSEEEEEEENDVRLSAETKSPVELQTEEIGHQETIEVQPLDSAAEESQEIDVIETKLEPKVEEKKTEDRASNRELSEVHVTKEYTPLVDVPKTKETVRQQPNLQPPTTAYQFETTWKQVRSNPQLIHSYSKVCNVLSH